MNPPTETDRQPQLDGLRAIAVGLVMIQHWVANPLGVAAPLGFVGVTMFFVLSGYLISGILFAAKGRIDAGDGHTIGHALKVFYARRSLRIFPAYYLLVAVLVIADAGWVRSTIGWLLTYTTNFQFTLAPPPVATSHLWTLAIEEQYYLIYPLLIIVFPQRLRVRLLVGMILAAFASRVALQFAGVSNDDSKYFTLSSFDSFALGGLLAHYEYVIGRERARAPFRELSTGISIAVFAVLFTAIWWIGGDALTLRTVWFRFAVSVVSLYVVGIALLASKGVVGRVLENRAVTFVGRISYGMYLFHVSAAPLAAWAFAGRGFPLVVAALIYFAITLAVATLSWFLFEMPVSDRKRHFPYGGRV